MRIGPCTKEVLQPVLGIVLGCVICIPVLLYYTESNMLLIISLGMFLGFLPFMPYQLFTTLYLGRTITLAPEGWTFSIIKHKKTYKWEESTIKYCENDPVWPPFYVSGPGILIYSKSLKVPDSKIGLTCCRAFHPLGCVFIRFKSKWDDKPLELREIYGYTAEKNEIIGYLKSIGVL